MNAKKALEGNNLSSTICKIIISDLKALENSIALSNALSDISDPSCGTRILDVAAMYLNLEPRTEINTTNTHVDNRRNFGRISQVSHAAPLFPSDKQFGKCE